MAQSERSKQAITAAGWINYQKLYLKIPEDRVDPVPPQQFKDIFMLGFILGTDREQQNAAKRSKVKST